MYREVFADAGQIVRVPEAHVGSLVHSAVEAGPVPPQPLVVFELAQPFELGVAQKTRHGWTKSVFKD